MFRRMRQSRFRPCALTKPALLAGLAFFALTSLTIAWSRFSGGLALIWPGSAILAATLVAQKDCRWSSVGILFALLSCIATALFGFGPKIAAPLAAINVLEGVTIAKLLLFLRPQRDWLESVPGLQYMILAVLVGTSLAAVPGAALAFWMVGGNWTQHCLDWMSGHTLGTLICFPLALWIIVGTIKAKIKAGKAVQIIECVLNCTLICGVCALAFFQHSVPLSYLPVLPLMYASFRCGSLGAILGLLIIAIMGAVSLQTNPGSLNHFQLSLASEVHFLQLYLAVVFMLALPVSVALKQHKMLLAELREKRTLESLISEYSDDVLLNLDKRGIIRYCSPAGKRLSGGADIIGEPLQVFFDPLDHHLVKMTLMQANEGPETTRTLERAFIRYDEVFWLETKLRAIPNDDDGEITGYAVTIRDVTKRKFAELNAMREAETDPLTGLPNRRALLRLLEPRLSFAAQRPFYIAVIDLDYFKSINDTYGHDAGDRVLRTVARTMRQFATPERFVSRLGGEEFAMMFEGGTLTEILASCDELRSNIAALRFDCPEHGQFGITASIGVAAISSEITSSEALSRADRPLYEAKKAGRNRTEVERVRDISLAYPRRIAAA